METQPSSHLSRLFWLIDLHPHPYAQDNGQLIHFRIAFTSTFFLLVDTIIINIIFGRPVCTCSNV
jgi:hypothetical protein